MDFNSYYSRQRPRVRQAAEAYFDSADGRLRRRPGPSEAPRALGCSVPLALIFVRREALTIRVEVRDLHRRPCRSRAAELGAA